MLQRDYTSINQLDGLYYYKMKNNYPLLLSATIAVIILLLLSSCGTRKTSQQKTAFKSDSLSIENTRVLEEKLK